MKKGKMARILVWFCISVLTFTLIWAMVLKTVAIFNSQLSVDFSDVLTYTAAAFGGELLLLAFKRVFAKKQSEHGKNPYEYGYTPYECEDETYEYGEHPYEQGEELYEQDHSETDE